MSEIWESGDSEVELLRKLVENSEEMAGGITPVTDSLLQEDGFFLLQEDGSLITI